VENVETEKEQQQKTIKNDLCYTMILQCSSLY